MFSKSQTEVERCLEKSKPKENEKPKTGNTAFAINPPSSPKESF
jgi:hypothetical protein